MKIGYRDFWVQFEPTVEQIINVLKFILRELNMNIPLWLFLLLILCVYIYMWRVKVSEWEMKKAMFRIWKLTLEIRDEKIGRLRQGGMNEDDIKRLNLTERYEWNQVFKWNIPLNYEPSILWFMKWRKNAKT